MNFAKVVGTVWATQKYSSLAGAKMQIIQPIDHNKKNVGAEIVAVDTVGAGPGEMVYFVTAKEAIIPYPINLTPIDASIVGIVDRIDIF